MTRLLLLAYYFPPIGGAGAQRSLKLARYLADWGFSTQVVTGSPSRHGRWNPRDPGFLAELPPTVQVLSVSGDEPEDDSRWRARAERWLRRDSNWSRWWKDGVIETGFRVGTDADVIVASVSPYQTAESAQVLSRRLGRPWVADLRDPWAFDEMTIYPTGLHRRLDVRRMRRLLASASAVVTTTPEAAKCIRRAFPEQADKTIVAIPNGFDADDFGREPAQPGDAFRIVHTGYLHTELGLQQRRTSRWRSLLGGSVDGVDVLTRSHFFLLQAIEQLVAADERLRSTIQLHLAGVFSAADLQAVEASPFVHTHGYVAHGDAVALMRSADLLFLPMHSMPPGMRARIVPGKTYEYLAAERPILAAVPDGDAKDILAAAGNARICDPQDVSAMAEAIQAEIRRWRSGSPAAKPSSTVLERYERRTLTAEYAALLKAVTAAAPKAAPRGPKVTAG